MSHYNQTWYLHGTRKINSININSKFSSAVSIIFIFVPDQRLRCSQCTWFYDISSNFQKYHLFKFSKISPFQKYQIFKNIQTSSWHVRYGVWKQLRCHSFEHDHFWVLWWYSKIFKIPSMLDTFKKWGRLERCHFESTIIDDIFAN